MTDEIKKESVHLAFSLVFLGILLVTLLFVMPKMAGRMGKSHANAFWTEERKEQARRLFGEGE
jgi:uncharacterized protein (UPF0333 family)